VKKIAGRIGKHARVLGSAISAVRGNISKSTALLQKARIADRENFRALRNILRINQRDRTGIDRLYTAINLIADCKPEAEPIIKALLSHSEGQLCQDIVAVLGSNQKMSGTFVEIGVGSGKSISNTYLLENEFGWNGLLIEPCRAFHSSIAEHRKAKLDKRAASSIEDAELEFFETTGNGEFSYASNAKAKSGKAPSDKKFTSYKVQTATLNRIFAEHKIPKTIDFISLDTEGSEIDILKGLDLSIYQVGLFCIEHNDRPGFVKGLDDILLPHGYRRIMPTTSAYDAWYVHFSLNSKFL
jgi:FkbM family methyltransferase